MQTKSKEEHNHLLIQINDLNNTNHQLVDLISLIDSLRFLVDDPHDIKIKIKNENIDIDVESFLFSIKRISLMAKKELDSLYDNYDEIRTNLVEINEITTKK